MDTLRPGEPTSGRDALTGLAGAAAARARLEIWLGEGPVNALLLTLARLDTVNIAYGSQVGDGALAEVAARIQHFAAAELDGPWIAARLGGGSFLLAASGTFSRERWALFAQGLAEVVSQPLAASAGDLRLAPRLVLMGSAAGDSAASVLERLASAAPSRRNTRQIGWVDGLGARPARRAAQLEADLLKAVARDEITILFQPQFALPGNRLNGAEALARWEHPQLGRIGAGALFSIAERTDHVAPLSRHIAAKALALAAQWSGDLRLSINVTAADLAGEDYAEVFAAIVAASGFPPERLTLEVTEQSLLSDIELARRSLSELVSTGMRVALDDFGAGFCNFRYLKLLPLHYLKLDRSMVDGIAEDARDLAVLHGIVAMARALDLAVIAEGIEYEAQRLAAELEGCASWQGFLKAEPMSAEAFASLAHQPG